MVEYQNQTVPKKVESKSPKFLAAVVGAALLAAAGVQTVNRNKPPQEPAINGPHKEYIVQQGDTVSDILQRAYPDSDWRGHVDLIDKQLPENDRHDHTLRPGQVLSFGIDSKIGEIVNPAVESPSGTTG